MVAPHPNIELLAPAGNYEKLKVALGFGADAVYLAGQNFSLRSVAGNFSLDEMQRAVQLAHRHRVRVYVACNSFPRSHELAELDAFLRAVGKVNPDALIVADPGVFSRARALLPETPLHISTQANTTNLATARFWQNQGARRINVARELSLSEIAGMIQQTTLEFEAFVHGAMCIAYSGRCLLSSFMARRESNRGACSHPCRWRYAVVEETRPGQYQPIMEDDRGTYLFNSRDLCMLEHLPVMVRAGIAALKIEGRMKSIHYLATVLKVYREALDTYLTDPAAYRVRPEWRKLLAGIDHRGYCTGFYLGDPRGPDPDYRGASTHPAPVFLGRVLARRGGQSFLVDIRNKLNLGEHIELLSPKEPLRLAQIIGIRDELGATQPLAQPGTRATLELSLDCEPFTLLRRAGHPP